MRHASLPLIGLPPKRPPPRSDTILQSVSRCFRTKRISAGRVSGIHNIHENRSIRSRCAGSRCGRRLTDECQCNEITELSLTNWNQHSESHFNHRRIHEFYNLGPWESPVWVPWGEGLSHQNFFDIGLWRSNAYMMQFDSNQELSNLADDWVWSGWWYPEISTQFCANFSPTDGWEVKGSPPPLRKKLPVISPLKFIINVVTATHNLANRHSCLYCCRKSPRIDINDAGPMVQRYDSSAGDLRLSILWSM